MNIDPALLICPACGKSKTKQAKRCAECAEVNLPEKRGTGDRPLCGAKKKDGTRCRAYAGQGVEGSTAGPCRYHGGATGSHRKHAVELEAKRRLVKLGEPLDRIAPAEALMGLLRATAGHINWLSEEIKAMDDLGTGEAAVLLRMYDTERDRLVRISEAAMRSGATAEEVRIQEAQSKLIADGLTAACREAGISATQRKALGAGLRKIMAERPEFGSGLMTPESAAVEAEQAEQRLAKLRERIAAEDERRVNKLAERRAQQLSGLTFPPDELLPAE